jgi:hypothetical protein
MQANADQHAGKENATRGIGIAMSEQDKIAPASTQGRMDPPSAQDKIVPASTGNEHVEGCKDSRSLGAMESSTLQSSALKAVRCARPLPPTNTNASGVCTERVPSYWMGVRSEGWGRKEGRTVKNGRKDSEGRKRERLSVY